MRSGNMHDYPFKEQGRKSKKLKKGLHNLNNSETYNGAMKFQPQVCKIQRRGSEFEGWGVASDIFSHAGCLDNLDNPIPFSQPEANVGESNQHSYDQEYMNTLRLPLNVTATATSVDLMEEVDDGVQIEDVGVKRKSHTYKYFTDDQREIKSKAVKNSLHDVGKVNRDNEYSFDIQGESQGVVNTKEKCGRTEELIHNYAGPYDVTMLQNARCELLKIMNSSTTRLWKRLRMEMRRESLKRNTILGRLGDASDQSTHATCPQNSNEPIPSSQHEGELGHYSHGHEYNSRKSPVNITATSVDLTEINDGVQLEDVTVNRKKAHLQSSKMQTVIKTKTTEISAHDAGVGYSNTNMDCPPLNQDEAHFSFSRHDKITKIDIEVIAEKKSLDQRHGFIMFKCDLCYYQSSEYGTMNQHLKTDVHFSASTYFVDSDKQITLKEKHVVVNKPAMYKTRLVMCPLKLCSKVFSDIYECAYHYKLCHDQYSEPLYSLVNIMEDETFDFPFDPVKCFKCGKAFSRDRNDADQPSNNAHRKRLIKHYIICEHFPYKTNKHFAKLFKCAYCQNHNFFFQDLKCALKHLTTHANRAVDGMLKIRIIHFDKRHIFKLSSKLNDEKKSYSSIVKAYEDKEPVSTTSATSFIEKRSEGIDEVTTSMTSEGSNSNSEDIKEKDDLRRKNEFFFIDRAPSNNETTVQISAGREPSTSTSSSAAAVDDDEEEEMCEEIEDVSNTELEILNLRYKCDYCATISENGERMYQHLQEEQHGSASTVIVNMDNKVKFINKKLSILCYEAAFKTMIAVCPSENCEKIFDDIYMCSEHFIMCHDCTSEPMYGLARVAKERFVKCPQRPLECKECGEVFERRKELNGHCKVLNHIPFIDNTETHDVYYFCTYCNFSQHTFSQVSNHMVLRHDFQAKRGEFSMRVVYLSRERVKRRVSPYQNDTQGHCNYLRARIQSLKDMKKGCGKRQKSIITMQIRSLKGFLKQQ